MQFKASLLIAQESSANVMVRMGRDETVYQRLRTVEEMVAGVMAVDAAAVQRLAQQLLQPQKLALALVGPVEPKVKLEELLSC